MDRRHFFRHAGAASLAALSAPALLPRLHGASPAFALSLTGDDEAFWETVISQFAPAPDFISLEYGYYCPAAQPTLEAEQRETRRLNRRASHYKRTENRSEMEASREALAGVAGASTEEIAIVRNATEAMNVILLGLDFEPGDEIVYGDQDYGSMVECLKQKAARTGVVLKQVAIPFHPQSDEEVVQAYADAITEKTRLLHVTHMINLTGHVLPVRKICDMAHERGVEVAVDSAHAFCHVDFKVPDLHCDYLGTSLHKWLCSPQGLGMLYVKKEKISQLWPLIADTGRDVDDIRKLDQVGTRPDDHVNALRVAIDFHNAIGGKRKAKRLQDLKAHWTEAVRDVPGVTLNTPWDRDRHGVIANIAIAGFEPRELSTYWFDNHRIFTVGIQHPVVRGVRVTPGLPTPKRHLDTFIDVVKETAAEGQRRLGRA